MENPDTNTTAPTVRIEKWIYGGAGLGRIEGKVVLAPFTLPGEEVRFEILKQQRSMVEARPIEILSPAPERQPAPCPYFTRCGGCHYQHAPYDFQLAQKRAILGEVLRRVGKLDPPEEIEVIAGPPWEYRNRSQFHLSKGEIGYLEAGSHRLCGVERCPISSPRINEALAVLREMRHHHRFPRFLRSIELFTNETEVQLNVLATDLPGTHGVARGFFDWCSERIPGATAGTLEYSTAHGAYRVGHHSFFQANRFLIDPLVDSAIGGAEGEGAVDLYAGVGLFSLPLAKRFHKVTAVESGSGAAHDLAFNAGRADVSIAVEQKPVEAYLESLQAAPDFILADPPRAGLGKDVVRHLVRLQPPRLAIVACDPATLARDLAPLIATGYRIARLTLADLFPQTYHFETVVQLER
jgi:23S rRNA (uracil1939-C5)-methyltransferase